MPEPAVLASDRYRDGVFHIGREHGFLPDHPPLASLPSPFEPLESLIARLPIVRAAGQPGLLASVDRLTAAVEDLPDLHDAVTDLPTDRVEGARTLAALFRSYTFLASAWTLAPAHHAPGPDGRYGRARCHLPAQIARPLVAVADALGVHPWLDYHYAYSLYNWQPIDPDRPRMERMRWDNLRMIARFSGQPDEAGFILLHVHINSHSGALVGSVQDALGAAHGIRAGQDAWANLRSALEEHRDTMIAINEVRREMWQASRWRHYNDFRVFIMGITGNTKLFGEGVVYEGVEHMAGAPQQFRGQTGAQDDIIPTVDIFSGVDHWYPDNELTRYLLDLRSYRPVVVQRFLSDLAKDVKDLDLIALIKRDPECLVTLMEIVEQVYAFRNGHWQFVQKYILATTRHEVATGGTPITTWIPNQIEATLACLAALLRLVGPDDPTLSPQARHTLARIRGQQSERVDVLSAQIQELSRTNWSASLVFDLNGDLKEDPAA